MHQSKQGAPRLKNPEKLINLETPNPRKTVDVFALGCVLHYALASGQHAFGERTYREVNVLSGKHCLDSLKMDAEAHNLVGWMIERDAARRPSAAQALLHPFFWGGSEKLQVRSRQNRDAVQHMDYSDFFWNALWSRQVEGTVASTAYFAPLILVCVAVCIF